MVSGGLGPIVKPRVVGFGTLGIEELKEYIIELNAEIKRAENYISSKEKDRLNAESLFKK